MSEKRFFTILKISLGWVFGKWRYLSPKCLFSDVRLAQFMFFLGYPPHAVKWCGELVFSSFSSCFL